MIKLKKITKGESGKRFTSIGQQYDQLLQVQQELQNSVLDIKNYINQCNNSYSKALTNYRSNIELNKIDSFLTSDLNQTKSYINSDWSQGLCALELPFNLDVDIFLRDIKLFTEGNNSRIDKLQIKLRELQEEFKEKRCFSVFTKIRKIINELKAYALRQFNKTGKYLRSIERMLIYGFKPNRIEFFRRLIQFLFKNMDSESGDSLLVFSTMKSNVKNLLKNYPNDIQRKSIG